MGRKFFVLNPSVKYFEKSLGRKPRTVRTLPFRFVDPETEIIENYKIYEFGCSNKEAEKLDLGGYAVAEAGIWNGSKPPYPAMYFLVKKIPDSLPSILFSPFEGMSLDKRVEELPQVRTYFNESAYLSSIFTYFYTWYIRFKTKFETEEIVTVPPLVLTGKTLTERQVERMFIPAPKYLQEWKSSDQPSSEQS